LFGAERRRCPRSWLVTQYGHNVRFQFFVINYFFDLLELIGGRQPTPTPFPNGW
jgi:hypothetical protein